MTGIKFRANRRRFVRIQFGRNRKSHPHSGQDHGDAFDVYGHTEDDGVEVFAKHADEGWVCCLEVVAKALTLFGCQLELNRFGRIEPFAQVVELLRCYLDKLLRSLSRLHIAFGEGLDIINNKGEQTREITVLDRWHKGVVLAERACEDHGQLRVLDRRVLLTPRAGDGLMLGCFTKGGVVVRGGRTPDVRDNASFGLVDVPAAVLFGERLVESRIGSIAGNDKRCNFMDRFDEIEGKVRDAFSAGCRAHDKELQVRVITLGGDAVLAVEVRHTRARGG